MKVMRHTDEEWLLCASFFFLFCDSLEATIAIQWSQHETKARDRHFTSCT